MPAKRGTGILASVSVLPALGDSPDLGQQGKVQERRFGKAIEYSRVSMIDYNQRDIFIRTAISTTKATLGQEISLREGAPCGSNLSCI
jgi:hypothetical protein